MQVGFQRNEDGLLNEYKPINNIDEALEYVRRGHKRRHIWDLDEVKAILTALHQADYPITLPFLTNHYNIYKDTIDANRKFESFKDVIKKFVDDGTIQSYNDLMCQVAPEYQDYFNASRSRLRLSTEEIRVKKFLDRFQIPYIIPRLSEKLPSNMENFANFVPDFVILDDEGKPTAIVEVFGSIGDRENSGVNELYQDKTQAKLDFYNSIPDIKFIEIYNNDGRCDLDDASLMDRFVPFTKMAKQDILLPDLNMIIMDFIQKLLQWSSG